jgi:transcriptional regulator with XRE-family HTH domain
VDDLLTLPLPKRIVWLHSEAGPRGKLSHDKFAEALGIPNRQTIIGWEKSGREPNAENAKALAEFSGFPAWVFRRRESEDAAWEMFGRRLAKLEARVDAVATLAARGAAGQRELRELRPLAEATPPGLPAGADGGRP